MKFCIFYILMFGSFLAQACPLQIENMHTDYLSEKSLCQIYDLYHQSIKKLEDHGVADYERLADFIGPRFINLPDWEVARIRTQYDPTIVYFPASETWNSWEIGQKYMSETIAQNILNQTIAPVTLEWILKMHFVMLKNSKSLAGFIRQGEEIGTSVDRNFAITQIQSEELNRNDGKIYSWHPTICLDQQSKNFQNYVYKKMEQKLTWFDDRDWPAIPKTQFFTSNDGKLKQCGYLVYLYAYKLQSELNEWLHALNSMNFKDHDFLLNIAKIQRWFIGIHPFQDGNGRISRNIVDYYFLSLGLPPPIFADMDNDIYSSETQWANEIGLGLLRSLNIVNNCAQNPQLAGCKSIPRPANDVFNSLNLELSK